MGGSAFVTLAVAAVLVIPAPAGAATSVAGGPLAAAPATPPGDAGGALGDGLGSPPPPPERLQELLRARIEVAGVPMEMDVLGERIHAGGLIPGLYETRGYEPAWVTPDGPRVAADSLVAVLASADRHGLDPDDYHLEAIRSLRDRLTSADGDAPGGDSAAVPGAWVDLELLLTDAFLTYGAHLSDGRVDPVALSPDWVPTRSGTDLVALLEHGLAAGRVAGALRGLQPPHEAYRRLVETYEEYRRIAARGGWPTVPEGERLSPGDTADRVEDLRRRLAATAELTEGPVGSPVVYDSVLAAATRAFQRRHGLEEDGVVGPATLAALNAPASERVRQIRLNLERWRWLPDELGVRHVRVNAADFELEVVEEGRTVLSMRAIVGRPFRKTPAFSDRISYLVFNPYWHVPHNLAVQDQLPLIKGDPGYLERMGFSVFQGWGADARPLDPATIDWQELSARNFPYRLRQDPGPRNALGRVKFMFPNRFSVYLHDTPARELFAKRSRGFSSGCIRLEDAGALARYLLEGDPRWSPEAVDRVMKGAAEEETVRLPEPVPVHLYYMTAWAGPDGTVHFRTDIYDRDPAVDRALGRAPPGPGDEGSEGAR